MTKSGILHLEDEDGFFGTLIGLAQQQHFRTAWKYLSTNIDPEHVRVYEAGVLLQDLSNQYGDIGLLKDECHLKQTLDRKVERIVSHLRG